MIDELTIAGTIVRSRLITGSGKYRDERMIPAVLDAAGCDIVTVALRRVDFDRPQENLPDEVGSPAKPRTASVVAPES